MICERCGTDTVEWVGDLLNPSGTRCTRCGGVNCQIVDDCNDCNDCCPNCGGDGVIYSCFDEIACVDPESGCDECERHCDWCQPLGKR